MLLLNFAGDALNEVRDADCVHVELQNNGSRSDFNAAGLSRRTRRILPCQAVCGGISGQLQFAEAICFL